MTNSNIEASKLTNQRRIVNRDPAKLTPYEKNARRHSEEQITQIVNSINEFGFTKPILIDENDMLLAGHGAREAALRANLTKIPCVQLTHLTDAQKRAYIIADNNLALNSEWDLELLAFEMESLRNEEIDTELLAFDDKMLEMLSRVNAGESGGAGGGGTQTHGGNRFLLMIEFGDEGVLETVFEEMSERGFQCKVLD